MQHALIIDGAVAELFDTPPGLHPSLDVREVSNDVGLGWLLDGGEIVPLARPALGDAQAAMTAAVNTKRNALIAGGYRHNFGGSAGIRTLDMRDARDETAWIVVERQASKAVAAGEGSSEISIRDASNETFTTAATTAVAAMDAMAAWRFAISEHSWALKDAIAAADDAASLDAIDIDVGWPD